MSLLGRMKLRPCISWNCWLGFVRFNTLHGQFSFMNVASSEDLMCGKKVTKKVHASWCVVNDLCWLKGMWVIIVRMLSLSKSIK